MKTRFLPCCLSLVLFISVQGCVGVVFNRETVRGSGSISEETYAFTGIAGVQLATIGELDIHLGNTLSSGGSVYYRGDPQVSDSHSSSGRVRRIR